MKLHIKGLNIVNVEGIQTLKRIRQYNMGTVERRTHAIIRQALKQPRKPLTMEQLQAISQKSHQTKDGK